MGKKRKKLISSEWRKALKVGIAITLTLVVAGLIFKAGLNIGFNTGLRQGLMLIKPRPHTAELLVPEHQQLRKDI